MIVKNESHCIRRCLKIALKVADEIIVVDTGSIDETPDIARSLGAKVIQHLWHDDFADARNISLEHAKGEWILVLDADEVLSFSAQGKIRTLTADTTMDGYIFKMHNFTPDHDIEKYLESYLTRLFRNRSQYRYEGKIHEQILPAIVDSGGRVKQTKLLINHYGYLYKTAQGSINRAERNLRILENILRESPRDPYLFYQLGVTYRSLGRDQKAYDALQEAIKHGAYNRLSSEILCKLNTVLSQLALGKNRFEASIEYASFGLKYNPDNLISLHVTGVSYMYLDEYKKAYPYLVKLRKHPRLRSKEKESLDTAIAFCKQRSSDE